LLSKTEAVLALHSEARGSEAEQQIDLGTLYNEYIRPGRGTTNVVVEVESPAARARVTRLLDAIEKDRHAPGRNALRS
jgi:hypothetical protein